MLGPVLPTSALPKLHVPAALPVHFLPNTPLPAFLPYANSTGFLPGWQPPRVLMEQRTSPAGYPLTIYTLSNGHRIMVEQRPTDIIALRTFVNNGSVLENAVYPSTLYRNIGLPSGLAHLDEHCRFLTTQNYPVKNSWTNRVEELGGRFNASTWNEFIQHELFFNREDTANMLRLHAESVLRPVYNPQDLGQEKTNVLNESELRTRKPMHKVYSKMSELLFDRPETQTLGSQKDILSTTPQHLAAFRNLVYSPTNMVTVVSGNVKPEEVLSILGPEFSNNPVRPMPNPGNQAVRLALRPGEVRSATIVDPQLSNSIVHIGFPAPARNNYVDRMSLEFLQEILDGDASSLLPSQLVNKQRLASELWTDYMPEKQSGSYRLEMNVAPGQEQKALQGARTVLSTLQQGLIPDQLIANTRERLVRRYKEMQGNVGFVSHEMAQEAVNHTLPYFMNYEQIANLITAEDLLQAAQKYLDPNTYAVVFGLPASKQGGQ